MHNTHTAIIRQFHMLHKVLLVLPAPQNTGGVLKEEFKVRLHQGSALHSSLFTMMIDRLVDEVRQQL